MKILFPSLFFSWQWFHRVEILLHNEALIISTFFHKSCLWCCILKVISRLKVIQIFSYVLSPMFCDFTFNIWSVIYFNLIYMKNIGYMSRFNFCTWFTSCLSTIYLKGYLFSFVFPLSKINWHHECGLFVGSLLCSIDLFVYSFTLSLFV
jgi:hypothetical protein